MNVVLDKKTKPCCIALVSLVLTCCTLGANPVYSQQAQEDNALNSAANTAAYECTQVKIDEVDPTLLTRAERVKRMEMNLHESIDGYATCMTSVQKNMAAGGQGNGDGSSDGTDGSGNGSGEAKTVETEASQTSETTSNNENESSDGSQEAEYTSSNTQTIKQPRGLIKPKDNDAIICRLLWDEIQKASAGKRTGFEKQYAEYKCG